MDYIKLYKSDKKVDSSSLYISDLWQAKYLGRKKKEDISIPLNGFFPSDKISKYYERGILINLTPKFEDNILNDVSYYKQKDKSSGHGRPVSEDVDLTSSDIKVFSEILDEITDKPDILAPLCSLFDIAIENNRYIYGWKLASYNESKALFVSKDKNKVSVKVDDIFLALYVSNKYLDVISNPFFWDANDNYLNNKASLPIMSLLSYVDSSKYFNYEKLAEEKAKREETFNNKIGYSLLCQYAEENDTVNAKKYAKYVIFCPQYGPYEFTPAIISAIKNNNEALIANILKYNSCEPLLIGSNFKSALFTAINKKNDKLFNAIADSLIKNKDKEKRHMAAIYDDSCVDKAFELKCGDYLSKLFAAGQRTDNCVKKLDKLDDKQFILATREGHCLPDEMYLHRSFDNYKCIITKLLNRLFKLNGIDAIKNIAKAIEDNNQPYYLETKQIRSDEQIEVINFILKTKNEELIDFACKLKYHLYVKKSANWWEYSGAIETYKLSIGLVKENKLKRLFNSEDDFNLSKQYLMHESLLKGNLKLCHLCINEYGILPNIEDVHFASASKKKTDELMKFVLDNLHIDRSADLADKEKKDLNWIYQGCLDNTSKEFCKYFFDNFKYFDLTENPYKSISYYLGKRINEDELFEYAVNKGVIKEVDGFDKEKGPRNIKEYIIYKNKSINDYKDLIKFIRDNDISFFVNEFGKDAPTYELSFKFSKLFYHNDKYKVKSIFNENEKKIVSEYNGKKYEIKLSYDDKALVDYINHYLKKTHWVIPYDIVDINNKIAKDKEELFDQSLPKWFIQQTDELGLKLAKPHDFGYIGGKKDYKPNIFFALEHLGLTIFDGNIVINKYTAKI